MTSEATISIQTYNESELEMIQSNANPSQPPIRSPHYNKNQHQKTKSNPKPILRPRETDSSRTITNDSFFNSINELELNNNFNEEVIFSMDQDSLKYDLATVKKSCPALSKYISQIKAPKAKITINLPQWITKNALLEYFIYNKGTINTDSTVFNFHSLIRLADCFENYSFLTDIIKLKIIPSLSYDSALIFIQDSFQKIDKNNLNYCWYELFTASKEYIAINMIKYIERDSAKLSQFQRNLLEEIIEYHLLVCTQLEPILFDFLMDIRHCHNIYDLIVSEYLISSSEENINYIFCSSYPNLQYSFRDNNSFYQEITKQYNKTITLCFFVSYRESDDIFNVNFKIMTESKLAFYSFTFVCFFNEIQDTNCKKSFSVKVISNTKGSVNILQAYQFKQKKYKKLTILIKMNPIHSFTLQYLIFKYEQYYSDYKIVKLSHTLLKQIILIIKAKKIQEEFILHSVVLWLNDEINLNDDSIGDILELIDWKKIPMRTIYTFLIKYVGLIEKVGLESYFINELKISTDLIGGIKDASCTTILNENFKLKKTLSLINHTPTSIFDANKELSSISKLHNNNIGSENDNNLFEESAEDENKKLFYTSREYQTRNHWENKGNKRNVKSNKTSVSENKKQSVCSNKNKTIFEFYEPIRTIEYEVNSTSKKNIEPYTSLSAEMVPMTTQVKIKKIQTNKEFIMQSSNKTLGNNPPSITVPNSNNHRTKTSTTLTHKSNLSSKGDKTLSSSGHNMSKKQFIKHQRIVNRNTISSPIMPSSKTTRGILLSKGK